MLGSSVTAGKLFCMKVCDRLKEAVSVVFAECRYDEHSHERFIPGDPSKRAFTYFVLTGGRFIYASAIRVAVLKFILSMTVRLLRHLKRPLGDFCVILLLKPYILTVHLFLSASLTAYYLCTAPWLSEQPQDA